MKTRHPSLPKTGAFSLVEALVTISVIGVMTALSVQVLPDVNGAAHSAKAMRNAQQLVSTFQSAQAAGLDFYDADFATTVNNIVDGGTVNDPASPFDGSSFSVPGMSGEEQTLAMDFLIHDTVGRGLIYNAYNSP